MKKTIIIILGMIVFWVLIYLIFSFILWDIDLIEKIIKSIPEKQDSRLGVLIFLIINIFCYIKTTE